jgi:hypothetical protein
LSQPKCRYRHGHRLCRRFDSGQACIGPGPTAFTLDESGYNGYTINSDHTITNIPVSTTMQTKNVTSTTLLSTAKPLNLFAPSAGLWAADLCATNPPSVACAKAPPMFSTAVPATLLLSIPLPPTPVMVVGPGLSGKRYFALSQNIANPTGLECNTLAVLNGHPEWLGNPHRDFQQYIRYGDSDGQVPGLCRGEQP